MVDWINISTNSGSGNATITVTASSYSELLERSTSLTVRTATKSAVVGITQRFNNDFVVSPTDISGIPYNAGTQGNTYEISVTANANWSITSKPAWVSFSAMSGSGSTSVTMSVSDNDGDTRNGTVTFTCGNITRTLTLQQFLDGGTVYTFTITPYTLSFPSSGGSTTVSITSNGSWELEASDWMTLSQVSGSGNATVTVTASPNTGNDRRGSVQGHTTNWSSIATAQVYQTGHYVGSDGSISPSSISLPFYETSTTIYVTSNVAWTLSIQQQQPHYLSVSPSNGMSGTSIPVTLTATDYNHSYSSRTTNIVLQNSNTLEILDTATVTQASREQINFSISNNFAWATASGGTVYIPYSSNVPIELDLENSPYGGNWSFVIESNRIVATCGSKSSCGVDSVIVPVVTRALGFYEILDYLYLVQDPACFNYLSGTNVYNVTSTSEPTELMQLNKAYIRSFKVDGVDVPMSALVCDADGSFGSQGSSYFSCAIKYTFGSTGNHTVVFTCVSTPQYQPKLVEGVYVNEIPLTNISYDATGSDNDLPYMTNELPYAPGNPKQSIGISGLTAVTMTLNALWCSACDGYGYAIFNCSYPYTYNLHIEAERDAVYYDTFEGTNATDLWFDGSVAPTWYGSSSSKFSGLAATGTAHAPSGSDYSEIASHLPSGWTLVYDA